MSTAASPSALPNRAPLTPRSPQAGRPDRRRPPLRHLPGSPPCSRRGADRLIGYQVVARRQPGDLQVRARLPHQHDLAAELRRLRRRLADLRHRVSSFVALLLGRADRDLDRPLPEPAGAGRRARRRRAAGRAAGGDPQRHPRLLGHPRPRPVRARTHRALAARHARLHPPLRPAPDHRLQRLHRRPDPDDHGDPDHRLDLPRPLPRGPARPPGRRQRARRDPLGGRARRRPAVDGLGRGRRLAARPRPGAGRGDRGRPR